MQANPFTMAPASLLSLGGAALLALLGLALAALLVVAARAYARRSGRRSLLPGADPDTQARALPEASEPRVDRVASDLREAGPDGAEAPEGAAAALPELREHASPLQEARESPETESPRGAATAGAGPAEGSPAGAAERALAPGSSAALVRHRQASEPRTRYPLVFAHGLLGFDAIELAGRRHEYFRGISRLLQGTGTEIYLLRVAPMGGVAARARQMAEQIRRLPAERVNIIAHSMGGLDARYAISHLGLSPFVASLTTIGTPHRGTPIADLGTSLLRRFGRSEMPFEAVGDLTTSRMAEFNRRFADVPGVRYGCIISSVKGGIGQVPPLLLPGYLFLSWQVGENDGLVPAESQRWGDVLGHIDANHWGQIGWSRGFDTTSFYGQLVQTLSEQGL